MNGGYKMGVFIWVSVISLFFVLFLCAGIANATTILKLDFVMNFSFLAAMVLIVLFQFYLLYLVIFK